MIIPAGVRKLHTTIMPDDEVAIAYWYDPG